MVWFKISYYHYTTLFSFTESDSKDLKFVVTPRDVVAAIGSNVTLYCIIESDPKATIQWFKYGELVQDNSRISTIGNGQVLEIYNVTHEFMGNYTCIAFNGYTSIRTTALVSILGEFDIICLFVKYMYIMVTLFFS